MKATTRLARELAARQLPLDPAFVRELAVICGAPQQNAPVLLERLLRGSAVIDGYREGDAPDAVWDRWEALLVAWMACREEVDDTLARGRRRIARQGLPTWTTDNTPTINWTMDTEKGT